MALPPEMEKELKWTDAIYNTSHIIGMPPRYQITLVAMPGTGGLARVYMLDLWRGFKAYTSLPGKDMIGPLDEVRALGESWASEVCTLGSPALSLELPEPSISWDTLDSLP